MKNADMPAMPATIQLPYGSEEGSHFPDRMMPCSGLTKREMFSMAAMQGMLSSAWSPARYEIAKYAVDYADALLKELDK